MDSLYILTSSVFFFWIIRNIFYWVCIWQENDYNISSFVANLKGVIAKKKIHEHLLLTYKLILLALFLYVIINDQFLSKYQYLISSAYFMQFFFVIREIYKNELKKPTPTIKCITIASLALLNALFIFSVPLVDKFFWLLIVDLTLAPFIGFFVFVISFPVEIYIDIQTEKAIEKMQNYKNVIGIMIIGDYGTNETKESIAAILRKKYKVFELENSEQDVLSIAKAISGRLTGKKEVIIAQIKTYNQDEITLICKILPPKVIVITGLNSPKAYINELTRSLPKSGIALYNGRDKNTYWLYQTAGKNKALYNYITIPANIIINHRSHNSITAYNLIQKSNTTSFDIMLNDKAMHLTTNKMKPHKIEHILPGIFLADYFGVKKTDAKKAIANLGS